MGTTAIAALAVDPLDRTAVTLDSKSVTVWALQSCRPVRSYSIAQPGVSVDTSASVALDDVDTGKPRHCCIAFDPSGLYFAFTTPSGV